MHEIHESAYRLSNLTGWLLNVEVKEWNVPDIQQQNMKYFKTFQKENQTTPKLTEQNNDEHDENVRIQNSIAITVYKYICTK